MKLLRHEIILFAAALCVLLIITSVSLSPKGETIVSSPSQNAVPYLININTATEDELILLDGIGPKLANRIIQHRNKYGEFSSVSELREVPGIGNSLIESIEEFTTT